MRNLIYISVIVVWGILFSNIVSCTSGNDNNINAGMDIAEDDCSEKTYIPEYLLSNYDDTRSEMLAADVSKLGSLAVNIRAMVKLTARLIYNTSVFWAKYAVRMIAEYIQHQSFIKEYLNSSKFRVGMTGCHVLYLYQLCRVVI